MLSKFEERLEMYAAGRPVTSDDELFRAVEKIMDAQQPVAVVRFQYRP